MNDPIRDRFRMLLVQERQQQQHLIDTAIDTGILESMSESSGDLSSYDQHTADTGAEMFEREKDIGLMTAAEHTLRRIDDALHRLDKGTYGTCLECGLPIGLERLEALPYAERCITCESKTNQNQSARQRDEKHLTFERSFTDGTDNVGYDGEDTWQDLAQMGTANTPQDDLGFDEPLDPDA